MLMNRNPDRVPGTCEWALTHPQFTEWQQSPHDDLLWISADPGCGKSVLAKTLVKEILPNTDKHKVLYFFFKDDESESSLAKALCALLHQLFNHHPILRGHALKSFQTNGRELQTNVHELWRIFVKATRDSQAGSITCVLDALDECYDSDRTTLISFLKVFHQDSSSKESPLKFLITSRPYGNEREFGTKEPRLIRLAGQDSNADISKEIDLFIRDQVAQTSQRLKLNQETRELLQQKLLEGRERTYLWLHLVFEDLERSVKTGGKRTKQALLEKINLLPSTVEKSYEKILGRLDEEQQKHAKIIFHIIVGSCRPLTLSEMDVAFNLETDSNAQTHEDLDLDHQDLERRIRELCGLFVVVHDGHFYLIHHTAKEFLVDKAGLACANDVQAWKGSLDSHDSQKQMTRICVRYLSLAGIQNNQLSTGRGQGYVDTSAYPFLWYSAMYWPTHFRSTDQSDKDLLEDAAKLYTQLQCWETWVPIFWDAKCHPRAPRLGVRNVHLAAFNGHHSILEKLLTSNQADLDIADSENRTPLIWGCTEGHPRIVQLLLERGADINAPGTRDGRFRDALQGASFGGNHQIVQLLLERGANVNASGGHFGNALQGASSRGHYHIVELLLRSGANVNALARRSKAPRVASSRGHYRIEEPLLSWGADTNTPRRLSNALHAASSYGHYQIVRLLLGRGADVNALGSHGNALHAASYYGHYQIARLLLRRGADVDALNRRRNALQVALSRGHRQIAQLLREWGADVKAGSQDRHCGRVRRPRG